MLNPKSPEPDALGRGVYSATEGLRLLNFSRPGLAQRSDRVSRNTVARWLRGYEHGGDADQIKGHSPPLWQRDYANDDDLMEISFRDLIELRESSHRGCRSARRNGRLGSRTGSSALASTSEQVLISCKFPRGQWLAKHSAP
jgi:hypothetical protein